MSRASRPARAAHRSTHEPAPADQADGLRRIFGGHATSVVPLVANPHVSAPVMAIERLASAFTALGRRVLVVDGADLSPPLPEAATLGLACCVQAITPALAYLPARGLARRCVDTRGSAARLLDDLQDAAPQAELLLLHGEATDLARIFKGRPARPVLLAADEPECIKHAYACWKLLAQRCGWLSADLLLLTSSASARPDRIAASLAQCADDFFGAALAGWAAIDPSAARRDRIDDALHELALAQLQRDESPLASLAVAAAWRARPG